MAKEKKIKKAKKDNKLEVYTTVFGRYGTMSRAASEAEQFTRHDVFLYRSAIFPNPVSFKVEAKIVKAEPLELEDVHPLYKFATKIVIEVRGEPAARGKWIQAMEDRMRVRR